MTMEPTEKQAAMAAALLQARELIEDWAQNPSPYFEKIQEECAAILEVIDAALAEEDITRDDGTD